MFKEARKTGVWLWGLVTNPDVVWVDTQTGEETREHWSRGARFRLLRPIWVVTFLSTNPGCGCRRRFGLWRVLICYDHAKHRMPGSSALDWWCWWVHSKNSRKKLADKVLGVVRVTVAGLKVKPVPA